MPTRMHNNSILVSLDKENDKTACGLFKPDGACEHIFRTATVVAVGPGKVNGLGLRIPPDVAIGAGVIVVKFLLTHTESAKGLTQYLEKDHAIVQPDDILLTYDRSDPPELG